MAKIDTLKGVHWNRVTQDQLEILADLVGTALARSEKEEVSTTKLLHALAPNFSPEEQHRLAALLTVMRNKTAGTEIYWRKTGKKNMYGAAQIVWLKQG